MQAEKRHIASGNQFNKYFGTAKHEDPLLIKGNVMDTIDLMQDIVSKTLDQTKAISKVLNGRSKEETASNIWHFIYKHIQYKPDTPGIEELRTPNRSWEDRKTGVDCDCYSIFISSILTNLGIKHALRITEYDNKGYYQHVYVVVPTSNNKYITIDPVLDRFNEEKSFTKKHDKIMIQHQLLNGINATDAVPFGTEFDVLNGLGSVSSNDFENATLQHLKSTFAKLAANPDDFRDVVDPELFKEQLAYAIENWNNPTARAAVLEELSEMEDLGELESVDTEESPLNGLGRFRFKHRRLPLAYQKLRALRNRRKMLNTVVPATIRRGTIQKHVALNPIQKKLMPGQKITLEISLGRRKRGGFWNKVKSAVNKVKTTVKAKVNTVKTKVKAKVNTAKAKIKTAGGKILAHNPLSFGIRKALLGAFKVNLFHFAEKLKWAFLSERDAVRRGFDLTEFRRLKSILNKITSIYLKMGGKPGEIKHAILTGRAGGLGFVAATAGGGAASGLLIKIGSMFKKLNLKKLFGRAKGLSSKIKSRLIKTPEVTDIQKIDRSNVLSKVSVPTSDGGSEDIVVDDTAMFDDGSNSRGADYFNDNTNTDETGKKSKSNTGLIIGGSVLGIAALAFALKGKSKGVNGVEVEEV